MSSLNLNLHENNVYLGVKGVVDKFPERLEKGVAKITKFTFDSNEDILYNLRAVRNGRLYAIEPNKVLKFMQNANKTAKHRRYNAAIALLKSLIKDFKDEHLTCILYGH